MNKRIVTCVVLLSVAFCLSPNVSHARYYDPQTGQWVTVDPAFDFPANYGNPYAYVGQNPINKIDPMGRFSMVELNVANAIASIVHHMNFDSGIGALEEAAGIQGLFADSSMAWETAATLRQVQLATDLMGAVSIGYLGAKATGFAATKLGRMRLGRISRARNLNPPPVSSSPVVAATRQGRMHGLFYTPSVTPTRHMPVGELGATNKYGDIWYDATKNLDEQQLTLFHEQVHSFLSPKFKHLQDFRANLSMAGYQRPLLRYIEEALSETYAQVRVNGLSVNSLVKGMEFPISNGYVTLADHGQDLLVDFAVGTVAVGGTAYTVYVITNDQ